MKPKIRIVSIGFGRFETSSKISVDDIRSLLDTSVFISFPLLKDALIVANLDFGHTVPIATLPVLGAVVNLALSPEDMLVWGILEH